jgi:hypothetical protein
MENTIRMGSLERWRRIALVSTNIDVAGGPSSKQLFSQTLRLIQLCTATWNAPPNFLLVDYYNYGDPKPGSVFEVAALYNNVTYTRACCGAEANVAFAFRASAFPVYAVLGFVTVLLWQ